MPTLRAVHRTAKNLGITLLLISIIVIPIYASIIQPVQANDLTVSPGKWDLRLGDSTGLVELSYPKSSILTHSIGDLLFSVTLQIDHNSSCQKRMNVSINFLCPTNLRIYIPPEFTGLSIGNLWTSFSNNYNYNIIRLSKQSSADEFGPNWWEITISNLFLTVNPSLANPAASQNEPQYKFNLPSSCSTEIPCGVFLASFDSTRGMNVTKPQYVRLFQVTSPTIAGRYFFKAFINGTSIDPRNFPTLVVKASRDPATISGTLRDLGDRNPSRAGQPISLAPGTGAQIIATGYNELGQSVSAQTFINSAAGGSYTLFGVAQGTYNITVYAAGFIPTTINQFPYPYPFNPSITRPTPITVAPAQSLEGIDIYLSESPNVTGTVLSQTASGIPIPWGTLCPISFRSNPAPLCSIDRSITVELFNLDGTTVVAINQLPFTLPSSPICSTIINCSTNATATDYHFLIQNELSSWSGEIPQQFAEFTSGLPTGVDYFVRAYVTSYVQLAEVRVHVANATLETEVPVPLIRTGIFTVTVHFKNSNFTSSDLEDNPITVTGGYIQNMTLTVSAYNIEGILIAQNQTTVFNGNSTAHIELQGFSNLRQQGIFEQFSQNYGILPGTYYILARLTISPPIVGNAATTTGGFAVNSRGQTIALVPGDLYYQYSIVLATIGLGEGEVEISFPMYRAPGIQLHIYSIDTEVPQLYRNWAFPGNSVFFTFIPTSETSVYQTNSTQVRGNSTIPGIPPATQNFPGSNFYVPGPGLNVTGLRPGSYDCFVYTLGYTQQTPCQFTIQLGTNADASIWMVKNPFIGLTVAFRHEGLLTGINSNETYAQPINNLPATPVRWEVFDSLGNFVAANQTYIPNFSSSGAPTQVANFTLAGFSNYYGDPRYAWSGFYDTTDQVYRQSGGLLLYPWELSQPFHEFSIRVWVDGYYQQYPLSVIAPTSGSGGINDTTAVSVVVFLDRASRISGTIAGPDYFGFARPQSWAIVDLESYNYTLSGIIDVEPGNYTTTSLDGSFQVWAPEGTYGMGVSLEGYTSYEAELVVPAGSDISLWIWLENYQVSTQPVNTIITVSLIPITAKQPLQFSRSAVALQRQHIVGRQHRTSFLPPADHVLQARTAKKRSSNK